ncbi:3-phosphoshikimate 1-carboxyvinyltransferase [Salinarimonas chemoclinalis]|uniref:3-phosphoshikimate 1-carboxyvinyltransferase n=1 Tax=Salinarimonas chemoclinalis TaxID=3241599 RepID=UPI00355912BC
MAHAAAVTITPPGRPLVGRVTPPGSKSITNRALLLAGLARGESVIGGALASDDTGHMAQALRRMGVPVRQEEADDATTFTVSGNGRLAPPDGPLFLGNAGTAMRFLTAVAALVEGTVVLDGDAHMRKRPIGPLTAALGALGVEAHDTAGRPPVTVHGRGGFPADTVTIDAGLSSQYVSALLMATACGDRPVTVALSGAEIGARGYVDLTLAAMRAFGAEVVQEDAGRWRVAPTGYRACTYRVEPDASAATYLWAAERLTGGAIDLGVAPADMTQPDAAAHALIARFPNLPETIDGSQMQDAVPTLAALAAFNETPVRFVGIANLRVKECDRVHAMATELGRVRPGLAREEGDDLVVAGGPDLAASAGPARIETWADHRIAMSMALVGLRVPGVTILDPACTAKTYPRYWRDLARLGVALRPE